MDNKLIISELFSSIQGESSYAGMPCFFIRLAGCNLNCSYCDTSYAKGRDIGTKYSLNELVAITEKAVLPLVEITGGEPLVQNGVSELCQKLLDTGIKVLLETNGTLSIAAIPENVIKIMDCKCPSSGESERMDFANFELLSKSDEVKFVIAEREDYEYARKIIGKYELYNKIENILFSPELSNLSFAAELAKWILEDKLKVRMQLQMHKFIWDPKERGR